MQRRTAAVLRPLAEQGHLVLHDITLQGWLDGLDHLVLGPTGVWVVASWRRRRLLPGGGPPARYRPRPARPGRGRGPRPGGLGPGPGPGAAVRAQPLVGSPTDLRRRPGGGPGPAPRHRPLRPRDPTRRPRAGHRPPARGPATGGLRYRSSTPRGRRRPRATSRSPRAGLRAQLLAFSRPWAQVVAQYYNVLCLGFGGYRGCGATPARWPPACRPRSRPWPVAADHPGRPAAGVRLRPP
jgi:hypothetical protein